MSWTVPEHADGARLVDVLREHLVVVVRRAVGPLISSGAVRVDSVVGTIAQPIAAGSELQVDSEAIARLVAAHRAVVPSDGPLPVLYEDDALVVVDVPAGLHLAPTGGHGEDAVTTRLLWHLGARPAVPWGPWRPYPVHRLDRAASGLLLLAKDATTADTMQHALRSGEVQRTYEATVEGMVIPDAGVIDGALGPDPSNDYRRAVRPLLDDHGDPTGAQPALTRWEVLDREPDRTRLRVSIGTGRTHQIRAHLASVGHPIAGDTLYGARPLGDGAVDAPAARIALRAVRLGFDHPISGIPVAAVTGRHTEP